MRKLIGGTGGCVVGAALMCVGFAPASATPRARGPKLRLTVAPKSAPVGRPTRFSFRVTRSSGRPVAGARVRFAGRRARTGQRGRAQIIATLHHSGRYVARATRHGFRRGRRPVFAHAHGGGGAPTGPSTFDGDCQVAGSVSFQPPLTTTDQAVDQHARATGTCSGTFTDPRGSKHDLNDTPVTYDATGHSDQASCSGGVATGSGTLAFPWGRIRFTLEETRGGAVAVLTLTGAKGGSARAGAVASPGNDPTLPLQQCAGTGLKEVGLSGFASTTPDISG